jgi:hypothetical protein
MDENSSISNMNETIACNNGSSETSNWIALATMSNNNEKQ